MSQVLESEGAISAAGTGMSGRVVFQASGRRTRLPSRAGWRVACVATALGGLAAHQAGSLS